MRLILLIQFIFLLHFFAVADDINFKKYILGDATVYAIEDKAISFKKEIFITRDRELIDSHLQAEECNASINTFLVIANNEIYLLDSGVGQMKDGKTLKALKLIGIKPEQVTKIILSHLHKDHIGGIINSSGGKIFENSKLYLPKNDFEFWKSENGKKRDNEIAELTAKIKSAYGKDMYTFNAFDDFFKGITTYNASGHTPGHTVFEFNFGIPFVYIADLIHCIDIQLPSDIGTKFDINQREAKITKNLWIDELSVAKKIILSAHIKFPGVIKFTPYNLNKEMGYIYYNDNESKNENSEK